MPPAPTTDSATATSLGGRSSGPTRYVMELFFDFLFVAAVAQVGNLGRPAAGLLRFSLLFVMICWSWLGHTNFSTRFDTDDLIQRSLTALQISLVAVMAINATDRSTGATLPASLLRTPRCG